MVDPQLRFFPHQNIGHALHRSETLGPVRVEFWYAAILEIVFEVDYVAREHNRSGLWQLHKKRLMSGRMSRRRNNRDAAIAKHIVITIELGKGMFGFEAR